MKVLLIVLLIICITLTNAVAGDSNPDYAWIGNAKSQLQSITVQLLTLVNALEESEQALQTDADSVRKMTEKALTTLQRLDIDLEKLVGQYQGIRERVQSELLALQSKFPPLSVDETNAQDKNASPLSSNLPSLPITLDALTLPPEECFIDDKTYKDDSIEVKIEQFEHEGSMCYVAYVNIADPSQLRTATSSKNFKRLRTTSEMSERSGGIVAINGDYFSLRSTGYVVRMGKSFRTSNEKKRDLLLVDSKGDFHLIPTPSSASTKEITEKFDIVNSFSFGPALVIDGQKQEIRRDYPFEGLSPGPRTAIAQMGPLSYAMVVVDGRSKTSPGKTHQQMADFLKELGAVQAFGLDGGGTTTMSFHQKTVNVPCYDGERLLSDIILFSSLHQSLKETDSK